MSSISRIASVIEGVLPLTARQVRDASDDLISHELIRPGRRGHGAESRDAREGALILLSSFGASSARGAGRLAKRLTGLSWKHGVRVDPSELSERVETASAVAALENAIGKRDFLDTQTELLQKFRQIQAALSELQAAANTMKDTAGIGVWHSYFTVELHVGERVIAEIRTGLERVPTEAEISFDMQPLRLFELMGVFADDAPITDPHLTPETRRFDMKAIAALGTVLAG